MLSNQAQPKGLPYQYRPFGAPVGVKARILTIVRNLLVRFDRRVRLECQALVTAGHGWQLRAPGKLRAPRKRRPYLGVCQRLVGGPKAIERTTEV